MERKKNIAIFMVFLTVFMPIAFAQGTADLEVTKYSGDNGVDGYANPAGNLNIEANAVIDWEDQISNDQVKICLINDNQQIPCRERGNWLNFDSCVEEGDHFKCTFTTPLNIYEDDLKFQVDLYDDDNRLQDFEQKTVVMDSLSPVIKEFTITPKATRGPVNLAYLVEDYGMHPDNTEQCSGIQEVKFTINGNPILSDRELTKGKCTKTKGVNYVYSGTEPIARVCAQAIDNVGLESEEVCEDFTRDEGPPEIKDIQLVDYNGLVLTHVKTDSPVDVKVRATVTDESGIESVNASIPLTGQTNYIPYTNKEGNNYYWTTSGGSKFTITQGSNGTIRVKATDKVGNSAQENFDYNIKLDTVPPTELSESSAATDDEGRPLLTYDSYLVLTFSDKDDSGDPGIGMRQRKAFLDLSELKMGSKVQADSCRNIMNDKWECKWRIQPPDLGQDVEPGVHNIVLLRSTQDDLGNKITDEERIEATYQQQGPIKPTVIEYNVIPGPEGVGGEAVRGDTVQFKVRAMNFESAEADFSEIEGESSKAPEECVYDNITDSQICTFEEVVGISGPAEVTINFTFTDAFGDSSTTEKTIDIYEIEGESTPNYWRSSVECSPHPIDRKTTSQIPQHVVCKVNLRTSHSNLETVNIVGPTSIYECMGNVSGFIDNIRTINTAPGSREPYLMIDLPARDYYLDNLTFRCPLSIYSKEERKKIIHSAPEEELVNIKLEFYDQPLGEIYEKRDKEINRAIDDARSLHGGIIKELEDFMKGAEDVCQWKNIITGAIAAGMGLVATLGGLQDTLPFLRSIKLVREPICHSVEKVDETWVTDVFNVVDSFCAIINCQASGGKEKWNIGRWTGGAAPWCMDIEKGLKDTELGAAVRYSQGTIKTSESDNTMKFWATNMKDNIYQSFACLCIPGILRNLNKIAQINCKYATCLYKDYKETGETMSYCKNMDHYLKCTYVWGGPLFDLIPFTSFFESISQMLGDMIANPISIATTALGVGCELYCDTDPAAVHTACSIARVASEVGEAMASIKAMTDRKNEMGMTSNEWCREMDEWVKDFRPEESGNETGGEDYELFE